MRPRVTLVAVLLLSQLLAPAAVHALWGDYAEGRGTDVNGGSFRFTAQGYGSGTSFTATGTVRYRTHLRSHVFQDFSFSGDVFCMTVVGNTAAIGGVVTHSSSPVAEGRTFKLTVQDNADPGAAADRFAYQILAPDSGIHPCIPVFVPAPIVDGDIEVVASTFPF